MSDDWYSNSWRKVMYGPNYSVLEADQLNCSKVGSPGRGVQIQGAQPIRKRAKHRANERANPTLRAMRAVSDSLNRIFYTAPADGVYSLGGLAKWLPGPAPVTDYSIPIVFANFDEANCECGADKAGSLAHSTWCPKHG